MRFVQLIKTLINGGYDDVDDYCNQNGLNYDDVFDWEEDDNGYEEYDDEDDDF